MKYYTIRTVVGAILVGLLVGSAMALVWNQTKHLPVVCPETAYHEMAPDLDCER